MLGQEVHAPHLGVYNPYIGRIVIVSDASFCESSKAAGWAGGIITIDGVEMMNHGRLVGGLGCANSAESMALYQALNWAVKKKRITRGEKIVLVTDSSVAVQKLEQEAKRYLKRFAMQRATAEHNGGAVGVMKIIHDLDLDYKIIRVPGHPTLAHISTLIGRPKRVQKMMRALDRRSRDHMKEMRAEILPALYQGQGIPAPV